MQPDRHSWQRLDGLRPNDSQVKPTTTRFTLGTWVLAGTASLGHFWLARPDLGPQLPPAVSLWPIKLYG